jgi:hypothetical protein
MDSLGFARVNLYAPLKPPTLKYNFENLWDPSTVTCQATLNAKKKGTVKFTIPYLHT